MKPWEIAGGDPWLTHGEVDAFLEAADELIKARRKAAEKTKQSTGRRRSVPHRRRR